MHFKAATLTTLVAATAVSSHLLENGMTHQHVTIQQQDQLCFSQVPFQVCIEDFRPETVFLQTMPMICMDANSSEAIQNQKNIREGKQLSHLKQKAAFEVQHMQRRAPRKCVKTNGDEYDQEQAKPIDIRMKSRSNWVPILPTATGSSSNFNNGQSNWSANKDEGLDVSMNKNEKYDQNSENFERNLHQMNQQQEQRWISETFDKQSSNAQKHLKELLFVGNTQLPRLNLHEIMRMSESKYQQWKTEITNAARYPSNAQWLTKYDHQLPWIYTNVVNSLRDEVAAYYPEQESVRELQRQFTRAVERAYLFVVQQVILERYHVPKDSQGWPLYPSVNAMVTKVWNTLKLELSSSEIENVQNSVHVYLQKLQKERPHVYEDQFQSANKFTFEKKTDLNEISKNLVKIAQTGLRLAAHKGHEYTAPESDHMNWAFTEEQAQREVEEAKRWFESKKNLPQQNNWNKRNQENKQNDQDQQEANKQQEDSYENVDENEQSMFNKLKVAIRSFEKTIRGSPN